MPYVLKSPNNSGGLALPQEICRHLGGASENDLKVIILVYSEFSSGFDNTDVEKISETLSISPQEVNSAIAFWRGAGFIKTSKTLKKPVQTQNPKEEKKTAVQKNTRPIYPAKQVAQAIESVPDMKVLVDFCQHKFNKLFNPSQLSILYSFYDNLGFGADIIMLVAEHCCLLEKPSLAYMEKILISLADNNITAYNDAEQYLGANLRYSADEKKLRKLCGFTSRELTPSEKNIISVWFRQWQIDFSLVEKAYEMTVDRISKPSLKYMNSILAGWYENGITHVSQTEQPLSDSGSANTSHDADEFFKAAVAKSMGQNNT